MLLHCNDTIIAYIINGLVYITKACYTIEAPLQLKSLISFPIMNFNRCCEKNCKLQM